MGEIENLQVEKTNCQIRRMRLEEEAERLKRAADALWIVEDHIESDYNKAQYDFDMPGDWKGNVYQTFWEQYHGMFWEQYHDYTWSLCANAEDMDEALRQKEREAEDAQADEYDVTQRIENLLYEQGYTY